MWGVNHTVDKYLYVRTNPFYTRLLGLFGVATIILTGYGFVRFFNLSPWYWIFFSPLAFIFIFNKITRYVIQIFYPRFDIAKHKAFIKRFWESNKEPSVDVFLPYCGESIVVYEKVLKGASNLDYKRKKVYVLDDSGKKSIEKLARKYNFVYLSRPNKGEYRKAGNLQYGYDHSKGEYVFILDADFIPSSDSLKHLIPYMVADKKIGILQTLQYFEQTKAIHGSSIIEFGGGNVVEEFYKIDMPSRDRFKGAMCVGTSAVYRKEAIIKCGGTPKVWGTEDVRQGLSVCSVGYYVKYLPLVVSIGKSPETLQGYFRQHNRWCTGSIATIFGRYYRKANVSWVARLLYLTNASYYLSEAGSVLFSFHFLALLYFHSESLSITNILWFVPYLVYYRIVIPFTRVHKPKYGTYIAAFSNIFTYLYTLPWLPFNKVLEWEPAGKTNNGASSEYGRCINFGMISASLYIIALICVLLLKPQILGNYNDYPLLFWSVWTALWYGLFLALAARFLRARVLEDLYTKKGRHVRKKAFVHTRVHLMPSLGAGLLASMVFGVGIAFSSPYAPTTVAFNRLFGREVTSVVGVQTEQTPEPGSHISDDYVFIAESGDSITLLARKSISKYTEISGISLDGIERNYVETNIAKDFGYRSLRVGESIVISMARLSELFGNSKHLTPYQRQAWEGSK